MQSPLHRLTIALTTLIALVALGSLASTFVARAAGDPCTAHVGGVEVGKKIVPELVLFNTTSGTFELDLRILDAAGGVLVDRPGEITVGRFATVAVDLVEQLARDLPKKTKVPPGLIQVEVAGDPPFSPDTVLIHVTQYFGKRAKPKAGFVLPAVYRGIPVE